MKMLNTGNKLAFNKAVVTELRDSLLHQINGGSALNDVVMQLTILMINK